MQYFFLCRAHEVASCCNEMRSRSRGNEIIYFDQVRSRNSLSHSWERDAIFNSCAHEIENKFCMPLCGLRNFAPPRLLRPGGEQLPPLLLLSYATESDALMLTNYDFHKILC